MRVVAVRPALDARNERYRWNDRGEWVKCPPVVFFDREEIVAYNPAAIAGFEAIDRLRDEMEAGREAFLERGKVWYREVYAPMVERLLARTAPRG